MKNIKLEFKGQTAENLEYSPDKFCDSFYQICQFKKEKESDKESNKNKDDTYMTRKVIFDQNFNVVKISEKSYDKKILNNFLKKANPNKYKIYPVNNLLYLELPNRCDFINVRSELSNNKSKPKFYNTECHDAFNGLIYGGMQNCNNMASPGLEISRQTRKVDGSDIPNFYNGAPTYNNLLMINNNLV